MVKYEPSKLQFHLNSLYFFKWEKWVHLILGYFSLQCLEEVFNRNTEIPGEKLLHLINLLAQDHQPTVKWKVCYISQQQSFQYRRNLRNNLHPLYYRYTQTHMHTHINIGTEKTRVGFEQVKQEFPSFGTLFCTRFPAKYCSSGRVRMSAEDSKKCVNLTSFICSLPSNFPSLVGLPPSLIRTRAPFGPAIFLLRAHQLKVKNCASTVKRFQLLKKVNWNEKPPLFIFFSLGKLPLRVTRIQHAIIPEGFALICLIHFNLLSIMKAIPLFKNFRQPA